MWIVVHAGSPFRAEELAVGGINFVLEGFHQIFYILFIVMDTIFDPEISMRRSVA